MRDILPPESALWEHIEQTAREVFRTYAYQEIRTPLVEPTELFARGVSGVGVLFQSAEELRHRQHYPQPEAK